MVRIVIEYLLPFLLPTALFALWLVWQRRRAATLGAPLPAWQEGPWFWLALSGLALVLAAMIATAFLSGYAPSSQYTPPAFKGGEVVPGQFKD
ncbi:MAG: DUF6111 family protein [Alphaproteobacteria bacterium]